MAEPTTVPGKSKSYKDPVSVSTEEMMRQDRCKCASCQTIYQNNVNLVKVFEKNFLGETRRYTMRICNKCLEHFVQEEEFGGIEEYSQEDVPYTKPIQPTRSVDKIKVSRGSMSVPADDLLW